MFEVQTKEEETKTLQICVSVCNKPFNIKNKLPRTERALAKFQFCFSVILLPHWWLQKDNNTRPIPKALVKSQESCPIGFNIKQLHDRKGFWQWLKQKEQKFLAALSPDEDVPSLFNPQLKLVKWSLCKQNTMKFFLCTTSPTEYYFIGRLNKRGKKYVRVGLVAPLSEMAQCVCENKPWSLFDHFVANRCRRLFILYYLVKLGLFAAWQMCSSCTGVRICQVEQNDFRSSKYKITNICDVSVQGQYWESVSFCNWFCYTAALLYRRSPQHWVKIRALKEVGATL